MNSRAFCTGLLLPAIAALALQGCYSDVDHTHLQPTRTVVQNSTLDTARQLINLPAWPVGAGAQVSMILRNLPDTEVLELTESRVVLYDCESGSCAVDRDPSFLSTEYATEYDGTFLAATAVGGGTYAPPGALGGGISWAAEDGRADTRGVAYGAQNARLYSTNYNSGVRRLDEYPTTLEGRQSLTSDLLTPRPARSWQTEPLVALQDALANDRNSQVHLLYFSPALFPLEFLPGLTCRTATTGLNDALLACIEAAFDQNNEPMYRAPGASSNTAWGSEFDWLEDVYDLMVDPANANAIFVVPAGDHGGRITASDYWTPEHQFTGLIGVLPDQAGGSQFRTDLTRRLNELFFDSGRQAPTNIFAWVPEISDDPTNVLPVVAVDQDGNIAHSSRCGPELADYCVAAPGFWLSVVLDRAGKDSTSRIALSGMAGNHRLVRPGGELIGYCPGTTEPIGLFGDDAAEDAPCHTSSLQGRRLMWVMGDWAIFRGGGSTSVGAVPNSDRSMATVTLPAAVAATEVAAAIATGALALMDAHFSSQGTTMSAADLLARLRMTANRTGVYSDANIYGQGLIDVRAALTPQGAGGIALTELARGARAPLDASALVLRSGLFGDALQNAFAGRTFVSLDDLHSPFRYPLDSLLQSRRNIGAPLQVATPLTRSLQRFADGSLLRIRRGSDQSLSLALQQGAISMQIANDIHPGLSFGSVAEASDLARTAALQADSALHAPWANADSQWHGLGAAVELGNSQRLSLSRYRALGRDNTDATALTEDDPGAQDAIALTWQADFATARFGLQHVRSQSADELLGIEASGGLGNIADSRVDAANSWGLIELSTRSRLLFSLWHLRARADNLAQGALASVDGLTADSWALALMLSGSVDTDLTLRLEQPLRARSGTLHFQVPTAHTAERRILFSALDAEATPSGRELRVQADFSVRLGERGGRLQLSAGQAQEPGHVRGAPDDHYALVGLWLPL